MKKHYQYVFVVLVYKNTEVLSSFFESVNERENIKVVIVNSYYDEVSEQLCKDAAQKNGADFLSVPNKGYGAGNNRGIEYAREHYEYDYLVLSNSDIILHRLPTPSVLPEGKSVIAPRTRMLNRKNQNPNIPFNEKLIFWLLKKYVDEGRKWCLIGAHALSRAGREIFLLYAKMVKKKRYRIFSVHGSFLLLSSDAIETLMPVFDERIFLYNEEGYLASKCQYLGIPCYWCPGIEVTHLEGASSSSAKVESENLKSLKILLQARRENDYFHGIKNK